MNLRGFSLFSFFILIPASIFGQPSITLGFGGNAYTGELNTGRGNAKLNLHIGAQYYIEDALFLKGEFNIGQISGEFNLGDDLVPNNRAIRFFNGDIWSLDGSANYEILPTALGDFYVGLGFGFMNVRLEDRDGNDLSNLPDTRAPGESIDDFVFYAPINVGIILFNRRRASVLLEQTWLLTNSDYLDNIGVDGSPGSDSIVRRTIKLRYEF